ncbi:hypothetical protein BDF14DRAFT_1882106 [Spinellus fusiger]|nr:hypothetical protein BDF14DRAFT_1882106 [Spinellus fusiger]
MLFNTTTAMAGSLRQATVSAHRMAQRQMLANARHYSSEVPKKSGNGLALFTLAALGAVGGIYYNRNHVTFQSSEKNAPEKVLEKGFDASAFKAFKLEAVEKINHNTSLYRFALPEKEQQAGLSVASCVLTRYPITKKDGSTGYVIRPYTPTSTEETKGHFDLIVKTYPDGKMSKHIANLKVGESLEIKGPISKYNWEENTVENVGMIAGGTGITPMLQIIRKVFSEKSSDNKTKITLIFANQTEEDILLKKELAALEEKNADRFKVVYVLDSPKKEWAGVKGYVTADLVKSSLPSPTTEKSIVFVCGPDPMVAALAGPKNKDKSQGEVSGVLKELGYDSSNVYKF